MYLVLLLHNIAWKNNVLTLYRHSTMLEKMDQIFNIKISLPWRPYSQEMETHSVNLYMNER